MTTACYVFLIFKSILLDHLVDLGLMEPHNTLRDYLVYENVKLTSHWLENHSQYVSVN